MTDSMNEQTKDQVAKIMLLHGTKEQQEEVLTYCKVKIPPRANMPLISAMAHKNLSNRPDYHKIGITSQNQKITKATCSSCNQTYSIEPTNQLIEKLPRLKNFNYANICLNCIKVASQKAKQSQQPALKELKQALEEAGAIYQRAYNNWKIQAKEYQDLDYQEQMINHQQKTLLKAKAPSTKKPASETDAQTSEMLAMKILANLSPEQQAAVLAQFKPAKLTISE